MSSNVRRTWDKEFYEKRAKDRLEKGDEFTEQEKSKKYVHFYYNVCCCPWF